MNPQRFNEPTHVTQSYFVGLAKAELSGSTKRLCSNCDLSSSARS